MRHRTLLTVGGLTCALVAGWVQPAAAMSCQTRENLLTAMHDEALAYAEYQAWATQATGAGNTAAADLLIATANEERSDHFFQLASAYQLVGLDAANLRTTIADERTEATTLYPGFSAEAVAEGDPVVGELFAELAEDEDAHQSALSQALRALLGGGRWPGLPAISPVAIGQGPAQSTGQTLMNVLAAMRGEAFASARYLAFSQAACDRGKLRLGALFFRLSKIELYEHFAQLAGIAGLVGSTTVNLTAAVAAEDGAITAYDTWSTEATDDGDLAEAALFIEIRGDEVSHRAAFAAMLGG